MNFLDQQKNEEDPRVPMHMHMSLLIESVNLLSDGGSGKCPERRDSDIDTDKCINRPYSSAG
jgi:hypothetical protein